MEPTLTAYIAGHFDGEGYFTSTTQRGRRFLIIGVNHTHLPTLELYKQHFGGNIGLVNREGSSWKAIKRTKDCWCWRLRDFYGQVRFLLAVQPYAIEKAERIVQELAWLKERLSE